MSERLRQKDLFHRLSPCGARLAELLFHHVPGLRKDAEITLSAFARKGEKQELRLLGKSPSGEIRFKIITRPTGVEIRFFEKSQAGAATVVFFMHPMNFHRTCEAAVDFVQKVAKGYILVARTKERAFPFGPRRLKFFDAGELMGENAGQIERVLRWRNLNI